MKTIEEGMVDARNQVLESSSPGNQALAAIQGEQAQVARQKSDDEAAKIVRKVSDPGRVPWGPSDYRYGDAYCAGFNLETGELANRYFAPNAVNVGGYDLATGTRVKSVVSRDYEGNAFYGAQQLKQSRTKIDGTKPPDDTIPLASFAASYQGTNKTYDEFASHFGAWPEAQRRQAWAAGTDALRHAPVEKRLMGGLMAWTDYSPMVAINPPLPTNLDFDVRMADKEFQAAGRKIYQHWTGEPFNDTDAEASRWLADHLRNLDFNTPYAAAVMLKGKNASWETSQNYIKALEAWSLTNTEWRLMPQAMNFGRMLADPINIWGTPIGKLVVNTAARYAALDFFRRMVQAGATSGAIGGMAQATAAANIQAKDPTAGELAVAGAAGAVGAEVIPLALQAAGRAVKRGINALKRPDIPSLPPNNVEPKPTGGVYGEITLPNVPGDRPMRTTPNWAREAEPLPNAPVEGEAPRMEQQPVEAPNIDEQIAAEWEAGARAPVTAAQADEMLGGPPVAQVEGAEAAAAALPPVVAPPPLPRDPTSRLFIDPATGYYSPVQKAVVDAKASRQSPGQWIADMKRAPFFKQDEFEWFDFDRFFKGKDKVTKEELLAHIDENLVKIQRHNLVPQRRNTVSWEDHLLRNNPEYGKLHAERQEQLDLMGLSEPGLDADVLKMEAQLLEAHMRRVAAEERRVALESGKVPLNIHGIEHMLTEFDTGDEIQTREALDNIFKALDSERKAQDQLIGAQSPAMIAQLKRDIDGYQYMVKESWKDLEGRAANMGAVIRPQDLERVEGMTRYGDPQVRDYSILGAGMRGTRYTEGGVDPIGHQISLYRHPEGVMAQGSSGHPGSDEPGTLGWAITSERNLANGETITFMDEVQADLAKERRRGEKEYKDMKPAVDADPELDFDGADALRRSQDYDDYVWQVYLDTLKGRPGARTLMPKLPEHWADATPAQRDAMLQAKDVWGLDTSGAAEDVPAMPKQIFYSTAQSNILKSELYHAVVNGKQNFGWATSDIIQERYRARPVIVQGEILAEPYGDHIRLVGSGQVRRTLDITGAYALADQIGGDNGAALRKLAHEMERLKQGDRGSEPAGADLYFDKETRLTPGAFWSYDVQMVKDMRKFIEKWGGKVERQDMPVAPGSSDTVKVWVIKIDDKLRKKLLERGVPIGAAAGAAVMAGQEEETQ